MSYQSETKLYQKAVDELKALGLTTAGGYMDTIDKGMKQSLKAWLRAVEIDPIKKTILTTDQNFALAAKLIADVEDQLDMTFTKPGQDWITDIKDRAYVSGRKYQEALLLGGSVDDAVILQGIDAQTLRGIKEATFGQVVGIARDQVDYLRKTMTESILHKRTWHQTSELLIRDGKIPSLIVTDKNGVKRFVEMRTRVDNLLRTETNRLAELGSKDKAEEIFGSKLGGRWHSLPDARPTHLKRDGMIRTAAEWANTPGPDGKIIMTGEEPGCRCWMEWADFDELMAEKAGEGIPIQEPPIEPAKTAKKAEKKTATPPTPTKTGKKAPKLPAVKNEAEAFAYAALELDLTYGKQFVQFKGVKGDSLNVILTAFRDVRQRFPMKLSKIQAGGCPRGANACTHPAGYMKINKSYANGYKKRVSQKELFMAEKNYEVRRLQTYIDRTIKQYEAGEIKFRGGEKAFQGWKKIEEAKLAQQKVITRWSVSHGQENALYNTVVHEWGHQVYYRLPPTIERTFETLYHAVGRTEIYKVSEYAGHNVREGFAECFAAYMTGEKIDSDLFRGFLKIITEAEKSWSEYVVDMMPFWEKGAIKREGIPAYMDKAQAAAVKTQQKADWK